MTEQKLLDKIAYLESLNDQLEAEISYVDELMRLIGFAEGLATVKETAQDVFDHNEDLLDSLDDPTIED